MEITQALALLRELHAELGEEAVAVLAQEPGIAPKTRRLLRHLLEQPASFTERRAAMVGAIATYWRSTGAKLDPIAVERSLAALGSVARERFVDPAIVDLAYLPAPLDIGDDQTISHPLAAACLMLAARPGPEDLVLDVGTGCGYQAALLAAAARYVISIELRPRLAQEAATRLNNLRIDNVEVRCGDGSFGAVKEAPFDAIVVAAGAGAPPAALLAQLRPGGRLVMPLGPTSAEEQLVTVTRGEDETFSRCSLGPARFVPLIGAAMRASGASPPPANVTCRFGAPITLGLHASGDGSE